MLASALDMSLHFSHPNVLLPVGFTAFAFATNLILQRYLKYIIPQWEKVPATIQQNLPIRLSIVPSKVLYIFSTYRALWFTDDALRANTENAASLVLTAWLVCCSLYMFELVTGKMDFGSVLHHVSLLVLTIWYYSISRAWETNPDLIDVHWIRLAAMIGFYSFGVNSIILLGLFMMNNLPCFNGSCASKSGSSNPTPLWQRHVWRTLSWMMLILRVLEWTHYVTYSARQCEHWRANQQRGLIVIIIPAVAGLCYLHWKWVLRIHKKQTQIWREYRQMQKQLAAAAEGVKEAAVEVCCDAPATLLTRFSLLLTQLLQNVQSSPTTKISSDPNTAASAVDGTCQSDFISVGIRMLSYVFLGSLARCLRFAIL